MRIESTEKYPIYIVTEDSFGTAYCIKANKCTLFKSSKTKSSDDGTINLSLDEWIG